MRVLWPTMVSFAHQKLPEGVTVSVFIVAKSRTVKQRFDGWPNTLKKKK